MKLIRTGLNANHFVNECFVRIGNFQVFPKKMWATVGGVHTFWTISKKKNCFEQICDRSCSFEIFLVRNCLKWFKTCGQVFVWLAPLATVHEINSSLRKKRQNYVEEFFFYADECQSHCQSSFRNVQFSDGLVKIHRQLSIQQESPIIIRLHWNDYLAFKLRLLITIVFLRRNFI